MEKTTQKTQFFASYEEFQAREDLFVNGTDDPNRVGEETTNVGCWNCIDCDGCRGCVECKDCRRCEECIKCLVTGAANIRPNKKKRCR